MANRRVWSIMLLIVVVGVVTFTPAVSGYLYWCSPKLWEGDSWTLHIRHTDQGIDILEVRLADKNAKAFDVLSFMFVH